MVITLDIETLPALDWTEADKVAHARSKMPDGCEDPDAWLAENTDELWRRTALDWRHGRIWMVGYAIDDDPVRLLAWPSYNDERPAGAGLVAAEAEIVHGLDTAFRQLGRAPDLWVGHRHKAFDLPWLRRVALREGLRELADAIPHDKWGKRCRDTAELWAGTDYRGSRVKLAHIASYLGLDGKQEVPERLREVLGAEVMDGSLVYELYRLDEHKLAEDYCCQDVELTRDVYRVLNGGMRRSA